MLDTQRLIATGALAPLWAGLQAARPYGPSQQWLLDNPYHRPTALSELSLASLEEPVRGDALFTRRSLVLQRLLFNAYEQNNLYLPAKAFTDAEQRAFHDFYEPSFVAANAMLRPALERTCFEFLTEEISVDGPWTLGHLEEYCQQLLTRYEAAPSEVCRRVQAATAPGLAAKLFILQVAPDFLSEASQMARALPGNFGPVHSELMKIFIDEFGYGVHPHKHSTLFERLLESLGLRSDIHAYYHWYLPSSLLMTSYFHWVTSHKPRWFEYVGALWWIEAVVPHFNRQFSKVLRAVFGRDGVDTLYFDEHVGIDMHHRRMALDKLIRPMVQRYGEGIIPQMVRGIEASRLLGDLAERDYFEQLDFCEALHTGRALTGAAVEAGRSTPRAMGTFLAPDICDVRTVLAVTAGAVEVDAGYLSPRVLRAGEAVVVPAGRMVGARVVGEGTSLWMGPAGVAP
ncbi:cupin domain-containing protein [Myxococcus stipitatus DSM 14675]|uniref:Cupin domain-containing protein n=1 Tax=Myxococcus stipitatus (strain DSM 14675 / JCM 12634 / Mx s8) TaxID=1278073 RepID=L7UHU1_MYXSD|nr:iron-containing redox enzyme family protein [Myxococcus stipitatus]AGC47425.1 cupin domain-containing protein [Myxococcus stipitatus DSM 14675]